MKKIVSVSRIRTAVDYYPRFTGIIIDASFPLTTRRTHLVNGKIHNEYGSADEYFEGHWILGQGGKFYLLEGRDVRCK